MVSEGDQAPVFALKSVRGQEFTSLDSLTEQRLLLLFYHNGHKGCCGDLLPSGVVSGLSDSLSELDTRPIGIAIDTTLTPKAFMASLDLPFTFLIDPEGLVHKQFGAIEESSGDPQRHTVLVGRDGKVHYSKWGSLSAEDLMALLNEIEDEPVSSPV